MSRCVFVTGAGGFMGSAIVRSLLAAGARVRALLGAPGQLVRSLPPQVETAVADITDGPALSDLIKGAHIVVHLAGPASVAESFESPTECLRVHGAGAVSVLDACIKNGVRRLVYVSSAEVYGRVETPTAAETLHPQPRSPYAAAKAAAEQMVGAFSRTFGISSVVLRPFSVYGAGMSERSLIGSILQTARTSSVLALNDLAPVRDYCHVDDVADAVRLACTVRIAGVTTLNVGTGQGTSAGALADLILRLLDRRIPIRERKGHKRPGDSEIYRLVADTTRVREVLGWTASAGLAEGLKRVISAGEAKQ